MALEGGPSKSIYTIAQTLLRNDQAASKSQGLEPLMSVQKKSTRFFLTPTSVCLVLPRKAPQQSELIVTHSGKSSLALPHMATRCAQGPAAQGRGRRSGQEQGASFSNIIICLLFSGALC